MDHDTGHPVHTEHNADHTGHDTHAPSTWGAAAQATLHCLTGCAIGEVLGMVLSTAFSLGNVLSIILSIVLAFVFGYGLTMRGVLRAGVDLRTAVRVALAADSVSIAVMELLDNFVMVAVPGALGATLADWLFWASLAFSLVVAFLFTTPVNKWMLARGRGHAVVHQYHSGHDHSGH